MRTLAWFSLLIGLVWLAGCADSGVTPPTDPDPPDTEHPDPEPDPESEVLCEALGYHCSIADVHDEVLDRGDFLLAELKNRLESGTSPALAVAWLEEQDGVREVGIVDSGIVFLLHGGIPMFLMTPDTDGAAAPRRAVPPPSRRVVGHDTPRENDQNKKRALIMSPFFFELGSSGDPGGDVATLLYSSRDYRPGKDGEKRIDWMVNQELPAIGSGRPTVEDFLGWHDYDFILLHTHGAEYDDNPNLCREFDPYFCVSGILAGRRVSGCRQAKELYADYKGVTCGGTRGAEGWYVALTSDFFDQQYGALLGASGLDKAIVIFSACHSAANGSLAAKLGGSRSEFFGWNQVAHPERAAVSIYRLLQLMVEDGLHTVDAYVRLQFEGRNFAGDALLDLYTRGGLYIREITTLKNPIAGSGSPAPPRAAGPGLAPGDVEMVAGDVLPFIGQAGDGEPDELFFFVDVDGVEAGNEGDFSLGIEVDDEELGSWSLEGEHARRIDETTVRLRIHQAVDFDVQPGQTATLKAITTLPDDGESPHELQVAFKNPALHVRSKIRTSGDGIEIASDVEGEVDLSFKRGENPDELEVAESIGDLRYLSFQVEMPAAAGCTFTTQTVPGRLGIPEADIDFKDPESGDFGVPEDLVLVVYPEIRETLTIECPEGSHSLDMIHWFAGFVSFHGGQLGGPNELDEARGGFVIENWQPGGDGVYARRVYQRMGVEDEVTFEEDTTLELRGPGYHGGTTGPPAPGTGHR